VPKFPVVGLNTKEPVTVAPSFNVTPVRVKRIGVASLEPAITRLHKTTITSEAHRFFRVDLVFMF
jgi:hypothetical protein